MGRGPFYHSSMPSKRSTPPWDPELHPAQIAAYQRMTPQEKMAAASDLYWTARELKMAWMRQLHPDWTEEQVTEETRKFFLHASTG